MVHGRRRRYRDGSLEQPADHEKRDMVSKVIGMLAEIMTIELGRLSVVLQYEELLCAFG